MKISVVTNRAPALSVFRRQLLHEMVKSGHVVLAFAPDHDNESRAILHEIGVIPVDFYMDRAGVNPIKDLLTILDLKRQLDRHKPDLSFCFFIKPVIYGILGSWLAGVRYRFGLIEGLGFAFTQIDSPSLRRLILQKMIGALARFSLRRAEGVFFLNPDDQREFIERRFVTASRTRLLGGAGVDLAVWPQIPLPEGPINFILVARLLRDKGIEDYVSAIRLVRRQYPDARFMLLGGLDDNPSGIRRSEVDAWVAEGLVEWPGHVAVRPWLEAAHVFVLPSYREGVPISTQEAMASGRPVITTDVPGCRETVVHGRNGYLIPPRSPTALAEAMERFLLDRSLIVVMGKESRLIAEERFDIHKQNHKLMNFMNIPKL